MAQVAQDSTKWNVKQSLKDFATLDWYESFISFLFRFAAKTSEPLLALGLVYSAANVLSKGHLSADNEALNITWAISQSVAMESSGGVVLVHGLQARSDQDDVKAGLYFILSSLLAVAGGVMLFMQLAGWESQGDSAFMLSLFALRCIVSVGYIYLCRAKHIRFSGTEKVVETPAQPSITDETMQLILARLEKLDALEQAITAQVVVSEAQEQQALPAPEDEPGVNTTEHLLVNSEDPPVNSEKRERVRSYLTEHPQATITDIMNATGVSRGYASTIRSQFQKEGE